MHLDIIKYAEIVRFLLKQAVCLSGIAGEDCCIGVIRPHFSGGERSGILVDKPGNKVCKKRRHGSASFVVYVRERPLRFPG